ncbi:flavin reductase (NADPH) [Neocloeon triangulifer]|uniref:flavin reductase (NADPH) n=1 Tax=Neocloeon triangulifer TaxID=2078957 RepID=UPI00286F90EE|nr:flavin reductase (NADPH) [Neocloeon triangulifer]XP_059471424.1 flavin reductase (NADPH) [Neocloeon triangulifer]
MAIKNVVIFGATGYTGLKTVQAAINEGLTVRAFVRDPEKVPADLRDKVESFKGDVLKLDDVRKAVQGEDAVIVALGTRNDIAPTTMMSEGMKNIVLAMIENGVRPVSVCLSAFLFFQTEMLPKQFIPLTEDHKRMDQVLRNSGLDWIAVYPPHIADQPGTADGAYEVSHEEDKSTKFKGRRVSVYDLGHFLVKSILTPEHYQKICGIASP